MEFVRIEKGFGYAWPAYVIVFDSFERGQAFKASGDFEEMKLELQHMHGHLNKAGVRFNAAAAVSIKPYR